MGTTALNFGSAYTGGKGCWIDGNTEGGVGVEASTGSSRWLDVFMKDGAVACTWRC